MIRSTFISAFTGYVGIALVYALWQLIRGVEPALSWLGLALAAGAPMAFIAWLYLASRARTPHHPVAVSVMCGLGTVITLATNSRYGAASGIVHIWAGLCLLGWFVYLRWYSLFPGRKSGALEPGNILPEFELQSLTGEPVSSNSFRDRNHVLVFYRGNWCPLCTAQISELAAQYRELQALGTEVVLISSQPQSHSLRLSRKFDAPMRYLRDENNSAAEKLGIRARFGTPLGMQILGYDNDTAMPTVIIINAEGKILYVDETDNYRVRPEPELFLDVLRKQ